MKIYTPPLDLSCLLEGDANAKAQSYFLRVNGESFKHVGTLLPHANTKKLAERERIVLKDDYGIDLKRNALATLNELIKVGQALEKERCDKGSFRSSGRKATQARVEQPDGGSRRLSDEKKRRPDPEAFSAHVSDANLASPPETAYRGGTKPRVTTSIRDMSGDHPLKSVLMAYVKNSEVSDLKEALGRIGDWRTYTIASDCRDALEWVDAQ